MRDREACVKSLTHKLKGRIKETQGTGEFKIKSESNIRDVKLQKVNP